MTEPFIHSPALGTVLAGLPVVPPFGTVVVTAVLVVGTALAAPSPIQPARLWQQPKLPSTGGDSVLVLTGEWCGCCRREEAQSAGTSLSAEHSLLAAL